MKRGRQKRNMIWWAALSLLLCLPCFGAGPQSVSIDVSPGTSYQLSHTGEDVIITLRDNRAEVRSQLERLQTRYVTGALVLAGRGRESVVRLKVTPGLTVSHRITLNPSRLLITLAPIEARRPVGQAAKGTPQALTALQRLDAILRAPEPPRPPFDPDGNILCLGSRVMYPVPLPEPPFKLGDWMPARVAPPAGQEGDALKAALVLLDNGKAVEAVTELRSFIRRHAQSPLLKDANYYLAEAMFRSVPPNRQSAHLEAIEALRDARRADPNSRLRARPFYLGGRSYLELRYFHEASTVFHDLLAFTPASSPDRVQVLLALAWADHQRFSNDESLRYFREALPLLEESAQGDAVLVMAALVAQKGEYDRVLKMLELIRERWLQLSKALIYEVLEGEALYRLDRFDESRARYERVRSVLGARTPRVYEYRLGESLMMTQKYDPARRWFSSPSTEARTDTRRWQEAMQSLRQLQMDMVTDTDRSRRLLNLEKLRKLRLENPFAPVAEETLIEFIKFYLSQDNLPDSLGMLRTFLTQSKANSQRQEIVLRVWDRVQAKIEEEYKQEHYFELLGLYERAFPVVADEGVFSPDVAYIIARAYMALGLYEQAYRAVTDAFFVEGSTRTLSDEALLLLVEIERNQRRFAEARKTLTFLRSRTSNPDSQRRAALEEALLLEAENRVDQAAQAYRAYTRLETDPLRRVQAMGRSASLLSDAKGCEKALPSLSEAGRAAQALTATKARAETADIFYRLGECQFTLRAYSAASSTLMTALSRKPDHRLASFARYAMARSNQELGKTKEAEIMYRALASEKSRLPEDAWVHMAQESLDQLEWSRSLSALN